MYSSKVEQSTGIKISISQLYNALSVIIHAHVTKYKQTSIWTGSPLSISRSLHCTTTIASTVATSKVTTRHTCRTYRYNIVFTVFSAEQSFHPTRHSSTAWVRATTVTVIKKKNLTSLGEGCIESAPFTNVPWVSKSSHCKQDLNPFSHVCTVMPHDRQTDTWDHRSQ